MSVAKPHLKFKHFNAQVKEAAEELLNGRPWDGTDEEKTAKFEKFLEKASAAYGVPKPTLVIDQDNFELIMARGAYDPDGQAIYLPKFSVLTLFHEFRHHLNRVRGVDSGEENDVIAWSTSLFYSIRPTLFRKRVRQGRILHVHPSALLADPDEYVSPGVVQAPSAIDQELSELLDSSPEQE